MRHVRSLRKAKTRLAAGRTHPYRARLAVGVISPTRAVSGDSIPICNWENRCRRLWRQSRPAMSANSKRTGLQQGYPPTNHIERCLLLRGTHMNHREMARIASDPVAVRSTPGFVKAALGDRLSERELEFISQLE